VRGQPRVAGRPVQRRRADAVALSTAQCELETGVPARDASVVAVRLCAQRTVCVEQGRELAEGRGSLLRCLRTAHDWR